VLSSLVIAMTFAFLQKSENMRRCESPTSRVTGLPEFNEHVLKLMQSHGIDRQKTLEVSACNDDA